MNFKMPKAWKEAYKEELRQYRTSLKGRNLPQAWRHLERAHIIGQYHPAPHTAIHCRMLWFGLRSANLTEVFGQILRIAGGWLGSLLNRIPVGNTGGANVYIFARMPIPEDLRELLADADVEAKGLAGIKRKQR